MSVSRKFLILGSIYLLIGIPIGMYMGAAEDFTLAPLHAHLNLLGFVLSILFALSYRVFEEMGKHRFAGWHFILHLLGTVVVLIFLAFLLTGNISNPATIGPVILIFELMVFLGVVLFLLNLLKNVR